MNPVTDAPSQPGAEHGPRRTGAVGMPRWPARPLGVLVLLAGLATLSYANTFSASFHFDDLPNIVENRQIRSLSVLRDLSGSRYIGFLTFAVNYHVGGLQVAGYHLVNLLIHLSNGFLVYTLVGLLLRTPGLGAGPFSPSQRQAHGVALITALVFVVHPIQTQAVTYIVQRFTSLATLWYLLALVCYLHWRLADPPTRRRAWWYTGALGATVLAMKTKEISFTLPVLLLVVEGVGFGRPNWKRWGPLVPFLLTLLIIPLSLPGGLGETDAGFARETTDISRLSYGATQLRVIVTYLRLLLWPVHQNLDYDYPVYDSFLAPPVLLSGVGLLCLLGLATYLLVGSARWKLVGFGVVWFFLTLAVESSLIPIRDVLVEHRLYLPSVGFLLAGSAVAVPLLGRWRALALTLGVGVVLLFAVATYQRNRVWHDEVSLWTDVVARSPMKARDHNNLGDAYARQGRLDEAIRKFMTALRLQPDLPEARYNLGKIYAHQGRWDEAIQEFSVAVQLRSDYPKAHYNLGQAYARRGRLDEAIHEFMTALRLQPDLPGAHANLGDAYAAQGRAEDAITAYRTALRLDPDSPDAHNNLGILYARHGRSDEAIVEFSAALHLQPEFHEAHFNLGRAYARQGRLNEAIQEFMTTLHLQPDLPEAHATLGDAYAAQGRLDEAIKAYRSALRLKPDSPDTHNNLGIVYARHGRPDEAIAEFAAALQLQPEFPEAHYNLGSAYARQGRLDEAILEYRTALRLKPDFPKIHYDLGNAYQLQGLTPEARRHFELAVRLQPDFTPAQHALAALDGPPQARR